jgi:hypothetical protein
MKGITRTLAAALVRLNTVNPAYGDGGTEGECGSVDSFVF